MYLHVPDYIGVLQGFWVWNGNGWIYSLIIKCMIIVWGFEMVMVGYIRLRWLTLLAGCKAFRHKCWELWCCRISWSLDAKMFGGHAVSGPSPTHGQSIPRTCSRQSSSQVEWPIYTRMGFSASAWKRRASSRQSSCQIWLSWDARVDAQAFALRIPVGMQPVIGMGGVVQPPGSPNAPRHMEVVAPPFAQMELDVEVMVPQEDEWLLPPPLLETDDLPVIGAACAIPMEIDLIDLVTPELRPAEVHQEQLDRAVTPAKKRRAELPGRSDFEWPCKARRTKHMWSQNMLKLCVSFPLFSEVTWHAVRMFFGMAHSWN